MSTADTSNPGLGGLELGRIRRASVPPEPRRVLLAWMLPAIYMAGIFLLSSFQWDITIPEAVPWRDKGVHFLEYLGLGFLCAYAARCTWPTRPLIRSLAAGALIAAAWGFGDELHQAFVPGRAAEVADVLADALGASVGACVCGLMLRARARYLARS